MNTFCCCTLKRHSYFLLITYINMALIGGIAQTASWDLYTNKSYSSGIQFLLALFVLFSIVASIMAFAAFMVYIFNDSWTNKYQQIYVKTMIIWLVSGLGILGIILLYSLVSAANDGSFEHFVGRWLLAIIFMALTLKWNLTVDENLKESLSGQEQDEEENQKLNEANNQA